MLYRPSRRTFLKTASAACLGSAVAGKLLSPERSQAQTVSLSGASLKSAASRHGRYYGVALNSWTLQQDAVYANITAQECSIVIAENALKWDATEPDPGRFTFEQADIIANFCRSHGIRLHGHTFVWHEALPYWLQGNYPPPLDVLERHMLALIPRYQDITYAWNVVNEVINHYDRYQLRVPREYIRDAFYIAASIASPQTQLVINDDVLERNEGKQWEMLKLLEYLKGQNVKVDGVGIQGHLFLVDDSHNFAPFSNFLNNVRNLGIRPYITEMDVVVPKYSNQETIEQIDWRTADLYKRLLDVSLAGGINHIFTWGLSDRYTWWRQYPFLSYITDNGFRTVNQVRPLLYDDNMQPKLARQRVYEAFI
ncbi:endo-1,4-beta-xylanase [Scytonema sp. NUACC26]|uniref:endo-1,4-beta-xylanase n=1 Tax=Scytonema sp. NUACC26 TaxID=3140176 RepID=UPI0034DBC1B7